VTSSVVFVVIVKPFVSITYVPSSWS